MVRRDRRGDTSARASGGAPPGAPQADGAQGTDAPDLVHPSQSPLYYAHHADRYLRQGLIEQYEAHHGCKFVVVIDVLDIDFVQNIEEHVHRDDQSRELHVMLRSTGGDGETALRAVRSMQARCSKLVLIIPDIAKSAATLLALGADEIRVGPTSDLGPIDPQMQIGGPSGSWYPAKAITNAVHQAEKAVADDRTLTPLWASLLAQVTALDYQAAKAELQRTETMVRQALQYRTAPPTPAELDDFVRRLVEGLQDTPNSHGTTLGPVELQAMGLPIVEVDPCSWEWECIWRLWTLYWVQIGGPIYESRFGSYRPGVPQPA